MPNLLLADDRSAVINATVRVDALKGQGVLVPGQFILTATHCIRWKEGAMALGDYFIETVITRAGEKFRVTPLSADPVSDLAVLGTLDSQDFSRDYDAFERWCEATTPVPIAAKIPQHVGDRLEVHVLTHLNRWIDGRITCYGKGLSAMMSLETEEPVTGGTSGGPVIDSRGELVGIVSNAADGPVMRGGKCCGTVPIVRLALPTWVLLEISKAT